MSLPSRTPLRIALALSLSLAMSGLQADPRYDLKTPGVAATVGKVVFTDKMLDVMLKSSAQGKVQLSRADVMRAIVESQLLGDFAVKKYGKAALLEDNKVSFKPEVVLGNEFTNMIQVAFRPELQLVLR